MVTMTHALSGHQTTLKTLANTATQPKNQAMAASSSLPALGPKQCCSAHCNAVTLYIARNTAHCTSFGAVPQHD